MSKYIIDEDYQFRFVDEITKEDLVKAKEWGLTIWDLENKKKFNPIENIWEEESNV